MALQGSCAGRLADLPLRFAPINARRQERRNAAR